EGKIITGRSVDRHDARGVARISVLERYGKGQRPANAYVRGFGADLDGAIASSVAHDSHNLMAVGSNSEDMRVAMAALKKAGGGFCVVQNGQVAAQLDLPVGGLMSRKSPAELKQEIAQLKS